MSHQDRNEFLFKLKYSKEEIQAINLYYEKLNKSKLKDNIPEQIKDQGVIDLSKESHAKARDNLLKLIEENKQKHIIKLS